YRPSVPFTNVEMSSKADSKGHVLTGHLLNPPVLLAGSHIACVVSLRPTGGSKHETNVPCRITGVVAYVVGQYKFDQQTLVKHKLNIPTKQISTEKFISDGDPHWCKFHCTSSLLVFLMFSPGL
ncbi:hypothetical protein CRM22_002885, partial [Opisthorchis felineus]